MKPYHRTSASEAILAHGFLDAEGYYLTTSLHRGVWLSDRPLDDNEGADGEVLLRLEIPEEAVARHEWVEANKTYREFLVPAATVNAYGPPQVVDDEDIEDDRWD
jgi:hypothetical protein